MAYTVSGLVTTVHGNQRVKHIRATADAASGAFATGFNVVDFLQWSPQSCTTGGFRVFMNASSGLTATNGDVAISGAANGDTMFIKVYGH